MLKNMKRNLNNTLFKMSEMKGKVTAEIKYNTPTDIPDAVDMTKDLISKTARKITRK